MLMFCTCPKRSAAGTKKPRGCWLEGPTPPLSVRPIAVLGSGVLLHNQIDMDYGGDLLSSLAQGCGPLLVISPVDVNKVFPVFAAGPSPPGFTCGNLGCAWHVVALCLAAGFAFLKV